MPNTHQSYRCNGCGYRSSKWMGFCPQCRLDEPLIELGSRANPNPVMPLVKVTEGEATRTAIGLPELDRVLGGGLVPGAVILLGGEPGVGKSTLILQMAAAFSLTGAKVLVASAEESVEQVGLRAKRLDIESDRILVMAETDVDNIVAAIDEHQPDLVVVDSIQTVGAREVEGAAGGVGQVRECAVRLAQAAKRTDTSVVLVGHVTKEGVIAGPKLLEHMVDVVLYLEGEPQQGVRALRSLKNRFGPSHQVGVFEMATSGLIEVADPSALFIGQRNESAPGSVIFPAIEGRRPLLVEVQALVAPSSLPQPRRVARGIETARFHQVLAVLQRHCRLPVWDHEVYVNVIGGLSITEPAADLAVALAVMSSMADVPLGSIAAWGEVGLTGEIRAVPDEARRREEAKRMGVSQIVAPRSGRLIADALREAGLGVGATRPIGGG